MPDAFSDVRQALRVFAAGAVVLVILSTVLFWMIGAVSGDDGVVITSPSASDQPSGSATTPDAPTDGASATDGATDGVTSEPVDIATSSDDVSTETPTETSSEGPSDPPAATSSDFERATGLSVQVLDAVLDDGRALHAGVVSCLRDAGFGSLITGNSASRVYDVTAVFYTDAGQNAAAARAVADEFGFSRVEVKPDNLSDTVALHIVVGRDATNPC